MVPIGYLYKFVAKRPDWLKAGQVDDVFSLSSCESENFADYISYWRHNGYWLFDSPAVIETLAEEYSIPLEGLHLFYYEVYDKEYNDTERRWEAFVPEPAFETNVQVPESSALEGFDVVSFRVRTSPECSPLSCNSVAENVRTNRHCLFDTFEEAKRAIEDGVFENCEPGPYRIVAVYSVDSAP